MARRWVRDFAKISNLHFKETEKHEGPQSRNLESFSGLRKGSRLPYKCYRSSVENHAPSISATARSWFDREHRSSKEPIIGIIVENYSKYHLQDPRLLRHHRVKTKIAPVAVGPGSAEFFVGEKEGERGGLSGGVSWQINRASGDRDERTARLRVKFNVKSR